MNPVTNAILLAAIGVIMLGLGLGLTTDDFKLVGPLGFVLDKPVWLRRYRDGGLVTSRLDWRDVDVRVYGPAAVAIGVQDQDARFRDNVRNGAFRGTHLYVLDGEEWKLAGIHLSPISEPPGAPPAGS